MRTVICIGSLILASIALWGCGEDPATDLATATATPKSYVTSEKCATCHLDRYDAWKTTLHSKMLQDPKKNPSVILANLDSERIRKDLAAIPNLKVPVDQLPIPKEEDVVYVVGSQWKQRYMIRNADGKLVLAPIQYNTETNRWVNYNEDKWSTNLWIEQCGGCHATGVNIEKDSFSETSVACEACHGPGSQHVAVSPQNLFAKRATIINPAKLTPAQGTEICGSCHIRGKSTVDPKAAWPVGYTPSASLMRYFTPTSLAAGNENRHYPNEQSKDHHQQYQDWKLSLHAMEGVSCTSCHDVHETSSMGLTRLQTKFPGSQSCAPCHIMVNNNRAHSIHSFGNCIGCHMPRIVKNAESGDMHSHTFKAILPRETVKDPRIANSCTACHQHAKDDPAALQNRYDLLTPLPKPQGMVIDRVSQITP